MRKAFAILTAASVLGAPQLAAAEIRDIAFPVDGKVSFTDDFGDARSGHTHEGNDLLGAKMMPLLSAIDGRVQRLVDPEASYGYEIVLIDADGWTYNYLHVNNDTPGTDDGMGGTQYAYAPGLHGDTYGSFSDGDYGFRRRYQEGMQGSPVVKGQLVGWMGDSGNAENVTPHLHFEIRRPDGTAIDPYESLLAALNKNRFDPGAATAAAPDINTDRHLAAAANPGCVSGSLVKTAASKAVYYCGADGKRYVFPNDKTYFTWYKDYANVLTITDGELAALQLGGNVTYRPGVRLVKITTDPKVYAVDTGGRLRWLETADIAAALYGKDWAKKVDDVSDAYFINYTLGLPVSQP